MSAVCAAIAGVNQAITSGNASQLLQAMQHEDTRLSGVNPENVQWYMDVLSKAIKDKAEVCVCTYVYIYIHICPHILDQRGFSPLCDYYWVGVCYTHDRTPFTSPVDQLNIGPLKLPLN